MYEHQQALCGTSIVGVNQTDQPSWNFQPTEGNVKQSYQNDITIVKWQKERYDKYTKDIYNGQYVFHKLSILLPKS